MDGLAITIIIVIIAIVVFLLLREFWCWYMKINEMVNNQRELVDVMKNIQSILSAKRIGVIQTTEVEEIRKDIRPSINENEVDIEKPNAGSYHVGDIGPAGGIIFYDKGNRSDDWQYMELAPRDQSIGIQWYNGNDITIGLTETVIGSGKKNTALIVSKQGEGDYAAKICNELEIGGYTDWFLPSKDELERIFKNEKLIQNLGFANDWYWSSSEHNYSSAWSQHFESGNQSDYSKYNSSFVRAVRVF
jgi:hypothetical protein